MHQEAMRTQTLANQMSVVCKASKIIYSFCHILQKSLTKIPNEFTFALEL